MRTREPSLARSTSSRTAWASRTRVAASGSVAASAARSSADGLVDRPRGRCRGPTREPNAGGGCLRGRTCAGRGRRPPRRRGRRGPRRTSTSRSASPATPRPSSTCWQNPCVVAIVAASKSASARGDARRARRRARRRSTAASSASTSSSPVGRDAVRGGQQPRSTVDQPLAHALAAARRWPSARRSRAASGRAARPRRRSGRPARRW